MDKPASTGNRISLPILFTLAVFLAYGIPVVLGWFGFYGDDWIYIQNNRMAGPQSFPSFVAWDRPYSAWIYVATGFLFGDHPLPYHLLLLVERWLAVFLVWKILEILWPGAERIITAAVLFFAVYPGFQQQPIAVQYILHFASLDLCLFSIFAMLKAWQSSSEAKLSRRWFLWNTAGVAASFLALFSIEYFFGLELVRPVILWLAIRNSSRTSSATAGLKQLIQHGTLYLIPLLTFVYWRVFVFSFQTYQPKLLNELSAQPLAALQTTLVRILADLKTVSFSAWRLILRRPANSADLLSWLGLILLFFTITVIALKNVYQNASPRAGTGGQPGPYTFQQLLLGTASLFTAGIPFWLTRIDIELKFPWDRPAVSFSFGAALFLSAILSWVLSPNFQPVALAAITALSIGFHYQNSLIYRNENRKMNDYFWQLAWRAPALEKGAILISEDIPLDRYSDNDLTPIVNWQYSPGLKGTVYDYKYFDLHLRYQPFFENKPAGSLVSHTYRSHQFESATDKVLALFYRENGCLRVLTSEMKDYPDLPEHLIQTAWLSNPEVILPASDDNMAVPPLSLGAEPPHAYCYYYQQIELAHQQGDFDTERAAVDAVLNQSLTPHDPLDWLPVVRALAAAGDFQRLEPVLMSAQASEQAFSFFCAKAEQYAGSPEKEEFISDLGEICNSKTEEQ